MSAIDETKRKIEIMQHFVDGGKVEFRYRGETVASNPWRDIYPEIWDWQSKKYRKKPEPVTVYVNVYLDQTPEPSYHVIAQATEERAKLSAGANAIAIAVPFTFTPDSQNSE